MRPSSLRRSRQKSEEDIQAEAAGAQTMQRVAQEAALADRFERLRDEAPPPLEATEGGEGRSPSLLSVERFPFLKLLFRDGSGSGILADEEDAAKDDNPMVHVFLWDDPLVSAAWFSTINLSVLLMFFADVSLLTLSCFIALWQLVVDRFLVHWCPYLQRWGVVSNDIDLRMVVTRTRFFSPKLVRQYADAAHEVADMVFGYWRVLVLEAHWADVRLAARFIFVVFLRSFSFGLTAYLILVALFTLPASVKQNRVLADALREAARLRWEASIARLRIWYEDLGSKVIVGSPRRHDFDPAKARVPSRKRPGGARTEGGNQEEDDETSLLAQTTLSASTWR